MDEDRVHLVMHGGFHEQGERDGPGLSICRHLTGVHGGEFSIESERVGTTVRLAFPEAIQEDDRPIELNPGMGNAKLTEDPECDWPARFGSWAERAP
jgi:hypothetical protein